ncbi:MAG TPA: ribosome maturation factor RimM [Thermoanaerobaculia bacterium]|nr:ribosome maturation factor RimM [Thermoanaerobaculia bacterium]
MTSSSSKTDTLRSLPEQIVVGIVARAHGVRGGIVVEPASDRPERFAEGAELILAPAAGAPGPVRVVSSRPYQGALLIELDGVTTRDEAEALRGAELRVPGSAVGPAPEGEYFHFELIGCRSVDRRAGELGRVEQVVADGGGWLLVVARPDGSRLPLPFVERFLRGVDRAAGVIEWDLPEGLIEACESRS